MLFSPPGIDEGFATVRADKWFQAHVLPQVSSKNTVMKKHLSTYLTLVRLHTWEIYIENLSSVF